MGGSINERPVEPATNSRSRACEISIDVALSGVDGQQITNTFAWPAPGIAGQTLSGQGNFQ
jgi:hypothetical protein